jgi:hypothetical protein
MKIPKDGSRWGSDNNIFHVLHTIELEGQMWIHYIKETTKETNEPREYSCYVESFLERFRELPDDTSKRIR